MEIIFWLAVLGAGYSYLLYPLILIIIVAVRPERNVAWDAGATREISVIITAHNEAARIREKITDTLALLGSRQGEVIVVSDASNDGTDEIVAGIRDSRVRLVRQESRDGKESGQRLGISSAKGDILVFSDVATRIAPGSLEALLAAFDDPTVGAVSSEDRFVTSDGRLVGEGLYVRYEMWLRRLESRLAGLVGLSGSFFAARRKVCEHWRTDTPSDFTVALTCVRLGLRAVSNPDVVGIYTDLKQPADEYRRKRRTVVRGIAGLVTFREVLNPVRYGWFAFEAWSHKLLRWAVPWFLVLVFVSSGVLATANPWYGAFFAVQVVGYMLVAAAWFWPALRSIGLIRIAHYFVLVNVALADGLVRYLRGERIVTWNPSRR
ncbi:glycosyltransferase [Wenzhouxiangella sp. XN24]|uniref:glycosyltransferase n=1 Tax=Wenzhouxiangella sp. XN24 TaxID=2713569 RepID=UPI003211EFA3